MRIAFRDKADFSTIEASLKISITRNFKIG